MRLILYSLISLFLFSGVAKANDALIYYSTGGTNTSSHYSHIKSELENLGFTVTGSTSGTVSSSDLSGKELVIDIAGTSNCGSTCKTNYESFIGNGGHVVILAPNGATNRIGNIESLIESKLSVGSMSIAGGCNTCYGSVAVGDYASSTSSENTLPGPDKVFTASGGTAMAKNSTSSSWNTWYNWEYGSNGGSITVSFGYGQLLSTHQYSDNMVDFLTRAMTEAGLYSTTSYTSSISSAQTTQVNNARGVTHDGNGIYITQSGNNNAINITQDGNDNLIAGGSTTTNSIVDATITGNNNTTTMAQRGDNNAILFDITGDYNTTTIEQGGAAGSDDNRILMDINGDYNTVSNTQIHNNGVGNNGHFLALDVDGDNNNILTSQLNDGDKKAFISAQGDDNDIDLYQQGTGSHYVEIAVGSDQTVDITQDGSGNHNASISMDGYSATIDLTQDSSTNQTYSLSQTCINANGCGTTTVTQQ
tara:strand:- start:2289 stop:3719 length:1431 start_codon:yes stop_codon:yes gene_type:complete